MATVTDWIRAEMPQFRARHAVRHPAWPCSAGSRVLGSRPLQMGTSKRLQERTGRGRTPAHQEPSHGSSARCSQQLSCSAPVNGGASVPPRASFSAHPVSACVPETWRRSLVNNVFIPYIFLLPTTSKSLPLRPLALPEGRNLTRVAELP